MPKCTKGTKHPGNWISHCISLKSKEQILWLNSLWFWTLQTLRKKLTDGHADGQYDNILLRYIRQKKKTKTTWQVPNTANPLMPTRGSSSESIPIDSPKNIVLEVLWIVNMHFGKFHSRLFTFCFQQWCPLLFWDALWLKSYGFCNWRLTYLDLRVHL